MGKFLAELKRRNVFKVATIYVVVSWLLLQFVSVVFPIFDIPNWASRLVAILLGLGFPVTLLMAWAFELTAEGIKRDPDDDEHPVPTHAWDWILVILLVVVIGLVVSSEITNWQESATQVSELTAVPENSPAEVNPAVSELSIAVLPFVNMSGDEENEYFSDGMSEEILNLLARIPALKVIGRTSSFAFKGLNEDLRVIGQALNVKTLLEGSVRKSGDRVRITAQLIDVADATRIWSESYDRTMTDIFAVQDDVAAAIIDALKIHIGATPTRGRPTEMTDAYSLFLKARGLSNAFRLRDAEQVALQAIEADPDFAEAYELLASIYWAHAGGIRSVPEAQALMGEAAAQALAIDPSLVLAQALYQSGNLDTYSIRTEIEALELAVRREPDNPWTLATLVFNLFKAGYVDEATTVAERLVELDPLSPRANGRLYAALKGAGRTGEAFAALQRMGELQSTRNDWIFGEAHLAANRDTTAITYFEAELDRRQFSDKTWVRELITSAGRSDAGQALLDRRIPEIVASAPEDQKIWLQGRLRFWYLFFGFLDRYFEIIYEQNLTDSTWSDADDLVSVGTINRQLGFTAHPQYPEVAELLGYVDTWEHRGPPDYCEKTGGNWVCN